MPYTRLFLTRQNKYSGGGYTRQGEHAWQQLSLIRAGSVDGERLSYLLGTNRPFQSRTVLATRNPSSREVVHLPPKMVITRP